MVVFDARNSVDIGLSQFNYFAADTRETIIDFLMKIHWKFRWKCDDFL